VGAVEDGEKVTVATADVEAEEEVGEAEVAGKTEAATRGGTRSPASREEGVQVAAVARGVATAVD